MASRKQSPLPRGVDSSERSLYNAARTMRILTTADLHYDILRSHRPSRRIAREICRRGGDVLVLVGDTAGADLQPLRECLRLFAAFGGRKLLVPGNHCLWRRGGESSIERYERILPAVAAEEGFAVLDHQPVVLGPVGLAGSIGWYDYAFRDERLGIPLDFYRAKVAPGAAAYLGGHEDLLAVHGAALTDRQRALHSRWMDGTHVDLGCSDEQFTRRLAQKLRRQLEELAGRVERIVAFLHHLPFKPLVPRDVPDRLAFAAAYMGSPLFGEVLRACEKVTDVYCGHSHWPLRMTLGHLTITSIGSTYKEKRLEVLEV